ncbi:MULTISPECIES: helix-turn-helix domain-containing protein [Eikenella]|uniref:DNA-binding protein n=1 Tax=Eikenella exigua TaxID=2528037 RepID=A0AAX1F868_9NEIS|nr:MULTISPECIES: helix-turn-helix domain-containing protein [Eikenella]QED92276.1 DNA-binding protein [Eikenella exigua]
MQTYNIREAAALLKCHHTTVCTMCKTGEIAAFKAGRAWVITETALENYIAAKQNEREQAVIGKRSKTQCQSISTNTGYGKYPFVHQAVSALDVLLEQPTDNSRKSCTIN